MTAIPSGHRPIDGATITVAYIREYRRFYVPLDLGSYFLTEYFTADIKQPAGLLDVVGSRRARSLLSHGFRQYLREQVSSSYV